MKMTNDPNRRARLFFTIRDPNQKEGANSLCEPTRDPQRGANPGRTCMVLLRGVLRSGYEPPLANATFAILRHDTSLIAGEQ